MSNKPKKNNKSLLNSLVRSNIDIDKYTVNFVNSVYGIQEQLKPFIKAIVEDSYDDPNNIYYKLGLDGNSYKIGIYNKKTKIIVIKSYDIKEFLELMSDAKKSEFAINVLVREMIVKSESKNTKQVIYI